MLAVQVGVKLFQEGKFDKIIVTRPAVSVDEDLGFLP
jgi:phosphate starvation-inducible protein PhoH